MVVIDVTDFGAKGDGVTDDTEALQRAYTELRAGDTLFFPKGIYVISTTIVTSLG